MRALPRITFPARGDADGGSSKDRHRGSHDFGSSSGRHLTAQIGTPNVRRPHRAKRQFSWSPPHFCEGRLAGHKGPRYAGEHAANGSIAMEIGCSDNALSNHLPRWPCRARPEPRRSRRRPRSDHLQELVLGTRLNRRDAPQGARPVGEWNIVLWALTGRCRTEARSSDTLRPGSRHRSQVAHERGVTVTATDLLVGAAAAAAALTLILGGKMNRRNKAIACGIVAIIINISATIASYAIDDKTDEWLRFAGALLAIVALSSWALLAIVIVLWAWHKGA